MFAFGQQTEVHNAAAGNTRAARQVRKHAGPENEQAHHLPYAYAKKRHHERRCRWAAQRPTFLCFSQNNAIFEKIYLANNSYEHANISAWICDVEARDVKGCRCREPCRAAIQSAVEICKGVGEHLHNY